VATSRMRLYNTLKEMVANISLYEDHVSRLSWDDDAVKFLSFCLDRDDPIITELKLKELIRQRLKVIGRECYQVYLRNRNPPDHDLASSVALAFAIRSGELTSKEVAEIEFDHGENQHTFMEGKIDGLIERILLQMKNPIGELVR